MTDTADYTLHLDGRQARVTREALDLYAQVGRGNLLAMLNHPGMPAEAARQSKETFDFGVGLIRGIQDELLQDVAEWPRAHTPSSDVATALSKAFRIAERDAERDGAAKVALDGAVIPALLSALQTHLRIGLGQINFVAEHTDIRGPLRRIAGGNMWAAGDRIAAQSGSCSDWISANSMASVRPGSTSMPRSPATCMMPSVTGYPGIVQEIRRSGHPICGLSSSTNQCTLPGVFHWRVLSGRRSRAPR